jgi:thioredoxin reductase
LPDLIVVGAGATGLSASIRVDLSGFSVQIVSPVGAGHFALQGFEFVMQIGGVANAKPGSTRVETHPRVANHVEKIDFNSI